MFIEQIVYQFGTLFTPPEEKVCEQGLKGNSMSIIVSGSFTVLNERNESEKKALLTRGDHFGEIAVLHHCKRTQSVVSIDYAIVASLTKNRLRMLLSDNPLWKLELEKHIFTYNDDLKNLLYNIFNRIEYFKDMNPFTFHKLIYAFTNHVIEENEILLR
jgi:CRP-like cAMP-binding protein